MANNKFLDLNGLSLYNDKIKSKISTSVGTVQEALNNHISATDPHGILKSPTFTGTPKAPTASAGTNTTQIATTAFVQNAIGTAQSQALVFKGAIPEDGLPTNPKVGDTYVVVTAGTYAGEQCEAGDTIICKIAKTDSAAATWLVVQKNIDGAVTTNSTLTANTLMLGNDNKTIKPLSNGSTGKILKMGSNAPEWSDFPTASPTTLGGVKVGNNLTISNGVLSGTPDTHYTSKNIVGNSAKATANATATNGNVYLNHLEENTVTSTHKISGSGATTVISDASGNITIGSTNTTYSAGAGISFNGTTINNSGVRSITAESTANSISVNTGGTTKSITINNVANAAYATNAGNAQGLWVDSSTSMPSVENILLIGRMYALKQGDTPRYTVTGYKESTTSGYDILVKNATNANSATTATTATQVSNEFTITNYEGAATKYNGSSAVGLDAITEEEISKLFS